MRDGQMGIFETDNKNIKNLRWCAGCNRFHMILFHCDKYSPELIDAIQAGTSFFKANGSNPEYVKTAINTSPDTALVNTLKAFAGIL